MKYSFTIILLLFVSSVFAQRIYKEKKLIQFSGLITDVDSNGVVPYVTATNLSYNEQKYSANYKGFFSFIAHPGDSILYTAVGYKDFVYVLPEVIEDSKFTAMIRLQSEIINLPMVKVYPWATVEEFTREFLSLKLADDDYLIASKNLSQQSLSGMIRTLPRDAGEISNSNYRMNHDRALNKNMVQTNPLLNPFAWGKLMQNIFKGDQSRSAEN